MGHAGAADGLHQSLLDDAVLHVQRQLAGALLRGAPADTVGEAGDISDLLGLYPLALLGNGSRAVISALGHRTHVLHFRRIDHSDDVPFCVIVVPFGGQTTCIIPNVPTNCKKHSKHLDIPQKAMLAARPVPCVLRRRLV